MARKLYLHAGAHRTGTSSFQLCMAANRVQLEAAGYDLAYPRRDGAPGGNLHLRLPKPKDGDETMPEFVFKVTKALRKHVSAERDKLILSDENLLGLIIHMFSGRLYPNRRKRLLAFRGGLEAVGAEAEHIVLVIRPYAEVFVSGYRKHAEDNPVRPFGDHAEAMAAFSGGWPEAVKVLQNVLKPKRLSVVDYGARGESRDVLGLLLGQAAEGFEEPARDLNVSATDAALEALQAVYHGGGALERAQWQQVIADFAHETESRGFAEFAPQEAAKLAARYEEDLARIADMEAVTLIR